MTHHSASISTSKLLEKHKTTEKVRRQKQEHASLHESALLRCLHASGVYPVGTHGPSDHTAQTDGGPYVLIRRRGPELLLYDVPPLK